MGAHSVHARLNAQKFFQNSISRKFTVDSVLGSRFLSLSPPMDPDPWAMGIIDRTFMIIISLLPDDPRKL